MWNSIGGQYTSIIRCTLQLLNCFDQLKSLWVRNEPWNFFRNYGRWFESDFNLKYSMILEQIGSFMKYKLTTWISEWVYKRARILHRDHFFFLHVLCPLFISPVSFPSLCRRDFIIMSQSIDKYISLVLHFISCCFIIKENFRKGMKLLKICSWKTCKLYPTSEKD